MIHLNLLPPEQKKRLHIQVESLRWRTAIVWLFVGVLFMNVSLVATQLWINQRQQSLTDEIQALQSESASTEINEVKQKINQLNDTISPFKAALPQSRAWSEDIAAFLSSLPDTITVNDFTLTLQGDLTITGIAATRSDFLALDEQLKEHPLLQNVETSSLASKRELLPFSYTASWNSQQAS